MVHLTQYTWIGYGFSTPWCSHWNCSLPSPEGRFVILASIRSYIWCVLRLCPQRRAWFFITVGCQQHHFFHHILEFWPSYMPILVCALSATFVYHIHLLFSDLDHYLSLYWRKYTNMDNRVVGHPMGKLQWIENLNSHGFPYDATTEIIDLIISIWQTYELYSQFLSYIDSSCMPGKRWFNIPLYSNWSTANIKIRYHCSTCNSDTIWKWWMWSMLPTLYPIPIPHMLNNIIANYYLSLITYHCILAWNSLYQHDIFIIIQKLHK